MKRLAALALTVMLLFSLTAQAESDLGVLLTNALYRIVLRTPEGDTTLGSAVLFADQKILLTAESCCVKGDLVAIGEDGEHNILAWERAGDSGAALMEMVTPSSAIPLKLANYDAQSLPFVFGTNNYGDIGSSPLYQALFTVYRGVEALVFCGEDGLMPGAFVADEKGGVIGLVVAQQAEGIGMYVALDPDALYQVLTAENDDSTFCPATLTWEDGCLHIAWTDEAREGGQYAITISGDSNYYYTIYKEAGDARTGMAILPAGHTYYVQVQWVAEGAEVLEPSWNDMNTYTAAMQPLTAYNFQQECYLTFAAPGQEGAITLPRSEVNSALFSDAGMEPYFQIRNTYDVAEEIQHPAAVELIAPDGQFFFLDFTYVFDPAYAADDSFVISMTEIFDVCKDFSGGEMKSGKYVIRYFIGGDLAGEYTFNLEE